MKGEGRKKINGKGAREREMARIEPGPDLLKSGSAENKRGEKRIEPSPLKNTLNNSCYSSTAWGEHCSYQPHSECASTEIAHYSELLLFTIGVYTSDNSGRRH